MHVAKQRHHPGVVELEGLLFALGPRAEVVAKLLVPADRRPEHVVLHRVAVQKLDRGALLHNHDVWRKHESFLVHDGLCRRSREGLAGDGIDIHDRLSGGDLAFDGAGKGGGCKYENQQKHER